MHKKRNFWGSHKLLQAHRKVCDENERKKVEGKKSKMLLIEVNAQKEKLLGFTQASASPTEKCAMKMKERK